MILLPCDFKTLTVLVLTCFLGFGVYYAYDIPSATNKQLQKYLELDDDTFNYYLNLFYTIYSLPNIALPLFNGYLIDRFGCHKIIFVLGLCVCLGQFFFTIGISLRNLPLAIFGRFVFGFGSESLCVGQSYITSSWFSHGNLGLAMGLNIAVGRLGSVFNDFISPTLAVASDTGILNALWAGVFTCFVSFQTGILLIAFDRKYNPQILQTKSEIELEHLDGSSTPISKESKSLKRIGAKSLRSQFELFFHSICEFPFSFWLLCVVMALSYGTIVPFNTIHSALLQARYDMDPLSAAQIMAIPE
jgi:nitrate/nitrite transporter NarK